MGAYVCIGLARCGWHIPVSSSRCRGRTFHCSPAAQGFLFGGDLEVIPDGVLHAAALRSSPVIVVIVVDGPNRVGDVRCSWQVRGGGVVLVWFCCQRRAIYPLCPEDLARPGLLLRPARRVRCVSCFGVVGP